VHDGATKSPVLTRSLVQALNFSSMTEDLLKDRLGVTFGGIVTLKADLGARAQKMAGLGEALVVEELVQSFDVVETSYPPDGMRPVDIVTTFLVFFTHSLGQASVRG
jgi:hypothetical protein